MLLRYIFQPAEDRLRHIRHTQLFFATDIEGGIHDLQAGVIILSLSVKLMIGIVIDFQLPSEKFLEKEYQKSEKLRSKDNLQSKNS